LKAKAHINLSASVSLQTRHVLSSIKTEPLKS